MERWLVQLEGERADLEEFPRWFPGGLVFAIEDSGNFYLVGPSLDALGTPEEVQNAAIASLDEYAAVISLLWPSFQKPRVGKVYREREDGTREGTVFMSATFVGRSKLRAELTKVGNPEPEGATQGELLIAAARTSARLHVSILLWSAPDKTWARLYRILEEVELDLGEQVSSAGICSEAERERFARTANTAEVAGHDARHALGLFQPPANPMSLREATEFIGRLLIQALRRRIPS